MQNIGHAKMRRQLTKTSLSTKPPPPPYLSTEKLALWNKWSESSNTAVIREAANKGIYIDLAITYLSLRRKTPPGETRQYFDKEVLSWMHELIKNRQVFKATHILNNVGMDPAEEISKIFCDTTDIDLREYLGTHLQSKEKLDQDLINSWILLKNIRASDLYQTIKEQEIETFNLNNIHKRNKEWKSKIAIELYFKTFDFGLEPLIIKEMLWTQFLENEKIDFLLVWITENLHAKHRFELEFNAIEKQQLTKHFIEGLRKFLRNLQITKEMLELISTTTNKQKEQLLTELAKFGIFSTKESSNIPLILSRFRDANSLENFHKLFGTTTTTNNLSMQKKHFQESLMNHLLKEELHVVLNHLIVVNNKYLNKKTVNFDLNGQNVCKLIREIVNLNQNSLKIEEEKRNLCSFFEATVDYLNFNLNSKDKDYPPLLTLTMLVLTSNLKITKKEDNKNRIIIINENNAAKIPHLTTLNERLNVVIKEEDDEKVEGNLEDDEKAEGNEKLPINLENDEKAEGNKEFPINLEDVEKAKGNKKLPINSEDDEKVEGKKLRINSGDDEKAEGNKELRINSEIGEKAEGKKLRINSEDDEKAKGNKKLRINSEDDEKAEGKKFPINSENDEKAKGSKTLRINSEIGEKAEGKKFQINSEDDEKAKGNKKLRINSEIGEKAEVKKLRINSEDDEKAEGNKKLRINSENDEKAERKKFPINSEDVEMAKVNKKLRIKSEDDEKAEGNKELQISSENDEKAEGKKFPINSEDDEKAEGNKEYPDLTSTEQNRTNKKFVVNLTSSAIKTMRKELPFIDHIFKKLEGNEERKGFNYHQLFERQLPIVQAKELFAFQHSKEKKIPHFSSKKLSKKYGDNKKLNYTFFIKQGRPLMASIFYLSSRNSSSTKMQQNIQENNEEINNEEKEKLSKQEEKETNIQEEKEINIQEEKETNIQEEKETNIQEEKETNIQEEKETNIQEEKETNIQEEKEKLSKEEVKEKIGKEEVKEKMSKEEVKEKKSNEKEVKEKLSKEEVKEKMSNQEEVKEKMSNVEKVKGKLSEEEVKEKRSNKEEVKEKLIKKEVKEKMCKEEVKEKMSKKEEVKEKLSKKEVKEKKSNEEEVKQKSSKEEVKEKMSKEEVKQEMSKMEEVKEKLSKQEVKEKKGNEEEVKDKLRKEEVKEKMSNVKEVQDKLIKEEVIEKMCNEEEVKEKSSKEEVKDKTSKGEEVKDKLSNVEEVKDKLCKQEAKEKTSKAEEDKEKLSKQEVKEKNSNEEEVKDKLSKKEVKEKSSKEEVKEKLSNVEEVKDKLCKQEVKEKTSNEEEVKEKLIKEEVKEKTSKEEEDKDKLSKEEVKEKTNKREEAKDKFSKEEVKEKTDNEEEVKEKPSNEEVKEKMCNQKEVEEKLSEKEKEELSNQIFKLVIKQFTNNKDNKNIKEIASSAVAFLELLNINSEELRVHIKIAELLDKKNNCELMLNNIYANPQLIYQLLENCMLERINSQQQDLQDLQKDFSYMQLLVKFANIHNLPLPELYLKKHVLNKDLWILFLMYITCFNYPLKQVMELVEYFSNGCIKEHFLNGVQMVENKSEKNVMRQRNARSSYLARVGVRRSGSESNLLAKNTQPVKKIVKNEKVEYVRQFTDLLEVLINAHNCIDPPKSLLKYAVMYKSPICALLTVSYEPESYLTAWLTWLMLTCNLNHHLKGVEMMNYSLQEVANILVECAEKLMLKKICLSFEIFIPEHPLRDFLQFIIDFKHLNQREDEEEATIILTKNLQSFKTKLESKKSANNSPFSRRNSEIEKTNQTKAAKLEQAAEEHQNQGLIYKNLTKTAWIEETASRLLFTTLQHEFTSKYSQIKFLKHLTNQGIKEFLPKTEIIEIVLKLLELLGDCDCLCPDLNLSLMLSPLEYRKEVIKCTEKLLNMNMYTKALEFLEISTVTLNFNLIKHWLINYKQIIENQIFETTKKDNFWLISDQHFNKKNQNQQANEVIEFYLQLIEKTENTNFEQTYQILNILNKWIIEEEESNSSNLQIETTRKIRRRKVERSLWSLYLQLLKKNKKKEKNIAPPIFQNVNENENTFQQDHEKEKEEDLKLLNKNKKKEKSIVPTFFQNANENENTFQQDHEKEEENLKLLNKTKKKEKSIAPPFFQNVNENENTFRHLDNHEREKEEDLKLLNKNKKKEKSIAPPFFQNVNENENTFRHLDNHEKEEDLKCFIEIDVKELQRLVEKLLEEGRINVVLKLQRLFNYQHCDTKILIQMLNIVEKGGKYIEGEEEEEQDYTQLKSKSKEEDIFEKRGKYIEKEKEQYYMQLKLKSKEEDIVKNGSKYIQGEKEQDYMQLKSKSKEEDIGKNGSKYIQGEEEQDYMQLKSKSKEEDFVKNGSKYIQEEEEQDYMQLKSKSKEEDIVEKGDKYIQGEEEQDYSHLKLKEEEKCVITHKNDNKKKTFLPNTNDVLNILEKLCNSLIVAKNYGLKIMRTYRITINCLNLTYKEIDLISGDSKSGFILLKRVLNSKNCVKNKLTVIADFAFIFNWDNKELAQFIAQEVYDFEEKGRIENEVLWNDFVNFNQIYQLFLLNEGTSILGHKLLNFCSSIEEDPNKIGIEIELLIKAHDCFTNDCNMEGITLVLQKAHLLIYRLQMCSEWKLIVRLLIGIGRYTEMSYVFELLRINQQFEYLLTKSSTNKDGLLKVALLDYLIKINQFVVDDKEVNEEREEFYNMVALHFSLYSEIATLWEKEGENNINSIIYSTNKTSNQTLNNKKPILLIPSDETKVFVNKAMMYFTHAAEYHIHGDRMSKAMDCANKAQLLALQTFLLTQEENQELPCYCVLQLNDEEIRFLITNSALNFHHVHVLLEAYKYEPDWSLILFERCILKEDPQFLTDYLTNMSLSEELLISLSNRYVSSKILNENSSKTMRNLLKHLHSVHMKYKIASKLSFIDIAEDLLEGNQLAYLKDTVWKKGYHGEPL